MQGSLLTSCLMELGIFNIPIRTSISDNSSREKNHERETTSSVKAPFSVEYGKMTRKLKGNSHSSTVILSMDLLYKTKDTKDFTPTRMATCMKEPGKMTSRKD